MKIIKYWRTVGTLQYYLPFMDGSNLQQSQKRGNIKKRGKNRKMENEFFNFLKNYTYDLWNQYYIFSSYLSIYQSRTRYRRDWDSNPSNLKLLFQKWMEKISKNGHFRALSTKRARRGRGRLGCKNPEFPPGTPNMKLESQICSLLKVPMI